jgi:hypothetical protein
MSVLPTVPATAAQTDYAHLLGALPELSTEASLPDKNKAAPKANKRQQERLQTMRQWFLEGVSLAQVELFAMHLWQVNRRTARGYIRQVKQTWAADSSAEDYLAQLWLAKLQREHLADKAFRKLSECSDVKNWMALLRVCHLLLKERDQLLARIHTHRVRSRRDTSPDSSAARRQRQGLIALSTDEWNERLTHWRNLLYQQWQTQQQEAERQQTAASHEVE